MKNTIIFLLLLWSLGSVSQTLRLEAEGTKRAVITGISDYQDDDISDLAFAHRDAAAFANYLQSPAGGGLPADQIQLLLNEEATAAQIYAALDWLIEESQAGDKAIIYFSGHGDVETKTIRQRGYLLAYDTPANNYRVGAIRLEDLNDIITTLSQQNKTKILMISDACKAGKLAGSSLGGTQATATALTTQFANEVKILSCQPDELSLEGIQWGGGRGVFSYYLIEGLIGLADNNNDGSVNLLEIENYLEEKVSADAAPQSQIPMTVGSKSSSLATIDPSALEAIKNQNTQPVQLLAHVDSRGIEEQLLSKVDKRVREQYRDFKAALTGGNLLDTNGDSASELYDTLSSIESLIPLHSLMRRNLAAALQDEAQQAINAYLKTDPKEMADRWSFDAKYNRYPAYLARAAELLGAKHYLYPTLLAKQYYFEGVILRLQSEKAGGVDSLYKQALVYELEALKYDHKAAFIHNELGLIYGGLKDHEKEVASYQKAITITPTWVLPVGNLALALTAMERFAEAEKYARKALELKPNFAPAYNNLGLIYFKTSRPQVAEQMYLRAINLKSDYATAYQNLALLYNQLGRYEDALPMCGKAIELKPAYASAFYQLGFALEGLNQYQEAEKMYLKSITLDDIHIGAHLNLGLLYTLQERHDEALHYYQKVLALDPNNVIASFGLCRIYVRHGNKEKAMDWLENALENGYASHKNWSSHPDLDQLQRTAKFKKLLQRYPPSRKAN